MRKEWLLYLSLGLSSLPFLLPKEKAGAAQSDFKTAETIAHTAFQRISGGGGGGGKKTPSKTPPPPGLTLCWGVVGGVGGGGGWADKNLFRNHPDTALKPSYRGYGSTRYFL
ncbi:MAG: hypothetical protein JSS67_05645 [Bacteroidetes bacterium]|nr:hypothetical protein [Bacteroidota bacterium]